MIPRRDDARTFKDIADLIACENVKLILVGLPRNMNNSLGGSAKSVQAFVEIMKRTIQVPVEFWDERLSTVSAERVLLEADLSRAKRKTKIDSLAAQIVLQNYLDSK